MLNPRLSSILRCPTHLAAGPLVPDGSALRCPACSARYPVMDGIPVLLGPSALPAGLRAAEAAQWDAQAAEYDDRRAADPVYMAGIDAVVRKLRPRPGEFILDAGCGTGLTVRRYRRPDVPTVALDLSLESVRYLRRRLPAGHAVEFVCGDVTALPFAARAFDKVLCANTLTQLPGQAVRQRGVAELARVVRPTGSVVVSVHNYSWAKRRTGWAKEGPAGSHSGRLHYVYRYDPDEFAGLLTELLDRPAVTAAGLPLVYRYKLGRLMTWVERGLRGFWPSTRYSHMLVGTGRRPAGPDARSEGGARVGRTPPTFGNHDVRPWPVPVGFPGPGGTR